MNILGIDKGTAYTKGSNGIMIRSTVRECFENELLLGQNTTLSYDGKTYVIGEKGSYSTDLMKSEHENTVLLVLTLIGLSYESNVINTNIVTGLPISFYGKNKYNMKQLFANKSFNIVINGKQKLINIQKAEVFPESAGAFYSQSRYKSALVIDIGGLSVDTALFEDGKLIDYATFKLGTMKLYAEIANRINALYDINHSNYDIEKVLSDGLYIDGERMGLDLEKDLKNHAQQIFERLNGKYEIRSIRNILLVGGASALIGGYLPIPNIQIMYNAQFANVQGYEKIGEAKF